MSNQQNTGTVISNKANKTVTVIVTTKIAHRKYNKIISKTNKYYVHDENNICNIGDVIKIQQTRPLSKSKRWKFINKIK
uniref:Small ribosomal subunit protein uS17c n=2 Tax=Gelidium TaxID=2811 RepID=A0A3G2QXM1_9FLOR|nr:ribosomal protein S17 [Gelidium gabrielsonii]YP_009546676.1 ribosomal protein S17 [Gelidium kathyanniae]AYO27801.1 ribosomal protein S17 [Gelidium gabrielsonii]AYO28024.1 ribosomal protein S17 [Gelidium kathyanniae]